MAGYGNVHDQIGQSNADNPGKTRLFLPPILFDSLILF
jgi:hypothetical protein